MQELIEPELRALTRDRARLLENHQAVESQLRAILDAYHPAPARLFSSMDREIALAFMRDYPTPAIASSLRTAGMQGLLTRDGYSGRVPAQTLATPRVSTIPGAVQPRRTVLHHSAGPNPVRPVTMESRHRATGSRTAADVVVAPDIEIRSPVSGTVKRAGMYVLYCDY